LIESQSFKGIAPIMRLLQPPSNDLLNMSINRSIAPMSRLLQSLCIIWLVNWICQSVKVSLHNHFPLISRLIFQWLI